MPLLDLFWTMLWFFMFFIWIWLLITIFADIFRSEQSGFAKAGWIIFVIVLPFLGVLIYLIAQGGNMQERAMKQASDQQAAQRDYIQSVSGGGGSSADEIEKLKKLHTDGTLTDDEYAAMKAKALA